MDNISILSRIKNKITSNLCAIGVIAIVLISFWIRLTPWNLVFQPNGQILFGTNDAWYHMRVLGTLLQNYPNRMFYNPWTAYPYGSTIHFGPLFEQMIAIPALILGLGHPSEQLINTIGALLPAILGAFISIPVYYIGKYVGDRKLGLIAALLIAVTPGQLMSRSVLGFTDNHVAEVFYSSLFIMFFMASMHFAKEDKISFDNIFQKNLKPMRRTMFYAVMTGVAYAAYALVWAGAPLFAFIVCVYGLVQYIINNIRGEHSDYVGITGIVTFFIGTLLVLPAIHTDIGFAQDFYSWFTITVTLGAMIGFIVLSIVERVLQKQKFAGYYYPIVILVIGLIGLFVVSLISPNMYDVIVSTPNLIFAVNTGGPSTIAEGSSIFYMLTGTFNFDGVFANFTVIGFGVSILMLFVLPILIVKENRPTVTLLWVWGILMLLAIYGQNRFAYYYSVYVALAEAYLSMMLLDKANYQDIADKIKKGIKTGERIPDTLKNIRLELVLVLFVIMGGFVYNSYNAAIPYTHGTIDPDQGWMDACTWLNASTPQEGMDFNALYTAPTNGSLFDYPSTAYGVMSWWDYGHYIEIMGHRMPNANPFQAGVGGRNSDNLSAPVQPGAAPYFTAQSEDEANAVLKAIDPRPNKMAARYVMSDARMATSIFLAMPEWMRDTNGYMQQYWTGSGYQVMPSDRYYNSMEARLHILDGSGLKHYRMVHESMATQTQELVYRKFYNFIYSANIPEVDTGFVKVFEYVQGANLTGYCGAGQPVSVKMQIRTNQNRTFVYAQNTTGDSNGDYTFTVPYSTSGPIQGQTQFDTKPITPYIIQYGSFTLGVEANETEVLNGTKIDVGERGRSVDLVNSAQQSTAPSQGVPASVK